MPRRLTQDEAKQRAFAKGFELCDDYAGIYIKVRFKCHCGNSFLSRPSNIFSSATLSCGFCNLPRVGEEFGKLIITEVIPSPGSGCSVHCLCKCGNVWSGMYHRLKERVSCGHCSSVSVGDRFGNLVVEDILSRGTVQCRCDCGRCWTGYSSQLRKGNNQSCGNCRVFRNGVRTSYIALRLHKMIGTGMHNYDISGFNVDIALLDEKIAIEYNEWIWHKDKLDYDLFKYKQLNEFGWKILCILSHDNLPTKDELSVALEKLRTGKERILTIQLEGWGKDGE